MLYKKCSRCELNYIINDAPYCELCLREMAGEKFCEYCPECGNQLDDDDIDVCKACLLLDDENQSKSQTVNKD